ncbi:4-carboxymuconolactone decarboxylase [Streptomyces sp. NBRC 14336]|uniref:carboxymuconolactone decarboxylase family protein n=1 Tax=Streptomyces sp. NBRC 14336 TaxID=3030992 RepID=UPI0024A35A2C|nr:carboxymuconolactone decarboxylase family protein [Streptomyces sp. NBRC 14336]WBO79027.1 carboxymuconolactone decarboxylase family protein [Streptomyces sp. SBE_14.2]GLW51513.1 4-carboxymuconolactone decarboxylase [Streptomyces sp. NBRC 14336]
MTRDIREEQRGNPRFERGQAKLLELGDSGDAIFTALADVAPDMGRYVAEFVFGDLYGRGGLDDRQRQLVTLALLTALGDTERQFAFHLNLALNAGVTPQEVVDALVHGLAFVGFPRTFNGLSTAKRVFAERGLLPVADAPAADAPLAEAG